MESHEHVYCEAQDPCMDTCRCNLFCGGCSRACRAQDSVAVGVALEGAIWFDANVICLLLCELGHLCSQGWQMQACHLLIESLRQQVDIILVRLGLLPILQEVELTQDLIGERARHHEGWMACCTTQIQQPPRS